MKSEVGRSKQEPKSHRWGSPHQLPPPLIACRGVATIMTTKATASVKFCYYGGVHVIRTDVTKKKAALYSTVIMSVLRKTASKWKKQ